MNIVKEKRLKTSVSVRKSLWVALGDLTHARRVDLSDGLEEALEAHLEASGVAPRTAIDPHAETIAAVRKILDGHPKGAEAIRAVVAALTSR